MSLLRRGSKWEEPPPLLSKSLLAHLASLPHTRRMEVVQSLGQLTDEESSIILHEWRIWARTEQVAPVGDWSYWLILAGRGFGKTRSGAEWVREQVAMGKRRIALVGPTAADARDVMVEGESGLMNICPSWDRPHYEPSKRRVTWPSGAMAILYSAEEPERLRGPQHDAAWTDEIAAWPNLRDAWDQLQFGLRLAQDPRVCVTTTPKPVGVVQELVRDPDCVVTRGSTYENRANVADKYIAKIIKRYEGTRLGRQELNAELLEDVAGALWTVEVLMDSHVQAIPDMQRVVIAVDPSGSNGEDDGDAQGIVAMGLGVDGIGYVLADWTCKMSPAGWGLRTVACYDHFSADKIVAEKNYGGEMVAHTIETVRKGLRIELVSATRGKVIRAEPVAALYEQKRIKHLVPPSEPGYAPDNPLAELEEEMRLVTTHGYMGEKSPNRMDALVWAATELFLQPNADGWLQFAKERAEKARESVKTGAR